MVASSTGNHLLETSVDVTLIMYTLHKKMAGPH